MGAGKGRAFWPNFALSLASVALTLGAVEIALRAFGISPPENRQFHFEPRPVTRRGSSFARFENIPNAQADLVFERCRGGACREDKRIDFKINSAGMRGREHPVRKPPNTYRVICLGDSFTFGLGVPLGEDYPTRLESLLNGRYRGRPRFEVLNAAVIANSTFDEWEFFRTRGFRYDPDLIVIGFYLNDSAPSWIRGRGVPEYAKGYKAMNERFGGPGGLLGNFRPTVVFPQKSYIHRWLAAIAYARTTKDQTTHWYRFLWTPENWGGLGQLETALRGFQGVKAKRRVPVLVVVFPRLDLLDEDYPFRDIHARIAALCRRFDLPVIDLLPLLSGHDPVLLYHHASDHHPSAWLNRFTAEAILAYLSAHPEFHLPRP